MKGFPHSLKLVLQTEGSVPVDPKRVHHSCSKDPSMLGGSWDSVSRVVSTSTRVIRRCNYSYISCLQPDLLSPLNLQMKTLRVA